MDDNERKDRESLADRLNKMLAALRSFGTNNAAAQGGIYQAMWELQQQEERELRESAA